MKRSGWIKQVFAAITYQRGICIDAQYREPPPVLIAGFIENMKHFTGVLGYIRHFIRAKHVKIITGAIY